MAKLRKVKGHYVLTDISLSLANDMYLDMTPSNTLEVNVNLVDNRQITEQQRKFIFALCKEISYFTGDDMDYVRLLLELYNANLKGIERESLSSCSLKYANGLIDTIITYCIDNDIPISGEVIKGNQYKFTDAQTYTMCLKRVCACCGARADIHHVTRVGMGNNRKKISHVGMRVLPLCRRHHQECHNIGDDKFLEKYCLTPVVADDKMDYFIKNGKIKIHREDG